MGSVVRKILFTLILASSPVLWAQDTCSPCYGNADFRDIGDLTQYIHRTASYREEIIPRKLVETMPRQDQAAIAATAQIECPGGNGESAQITIIGNLVTTAAHLFTDRNCKVLANPKDCKFVIVVGGRTRRYPIVERLDHGFDSCPNKLPAPTDDWAVIQLESRVEGVDPYLIDENKAATIKAGDRVATVGHSIDFHRRYTKDGTMVLPKHYGTCAVEKIYYGKGKPIFISAPCGCSKGCTGGSLVTVDDPHPALIAIVNQNLETDKQLAAEAASGEPVLLSYAEVKGGEKTGSTQYLPFSGRFLTATKAAAEKLSRLSER